MTAKEAQGRRMGAMVGKTSGMAPATLRMMHTSSEKCSELLVQEATKVVGMKVSRKGGNNIKGNRSTNHLLKAKISNNRGRPVRPVWACNPSRVRVLCLESYYNPIWKGYVLSGL